MSLNQKLNLLKKSGIRKSVNAKLKEFSKGKSLNNKQKFRELCFCILVAGSNLEQTKKAWEKNKDNFHKLGQKELQEALRKCGCRFNHRAEYIIEAKKSLNKINFNEEPFILREILVQNVKGLGMKEASHFLRNLGHQNFAILDRHVLKTLQNNKFIKKIPKTLTKKVYLKIENQLKPLAKKLGMSMAELDIYLFYLNSKKITQK
jgi:N-glycosylase/DNA lyase